LKTLFVSSGRSGSISVLVKNQGESLIKAGINVDYFIIEGRGIIGYVKSIPLLRRTIINGDYDLVHAHYSVSAFVAAIASRPAPLVASLMGSDVYSSNFTKKIIRFFSKKCWKATIVKTDRMKELLGLNNVSVIPNGVNLELFKPENNIQARNKLGLSADNKIVLFVSTHDRPEKNFPLAQEAVSLMHNDQVKLHYIKSTRHELIPSYLNAADVLLLTSFYEGSPNIIKEAMACNCPIVSTNVGDVDWLLDGLEGCYVTSNDPSDIADKLNKALKFNSRTNGRKRITELGLDSLTTAGRIVNIYKNIIEKDA
jgi:glycosyltransferase involved in cell wall biosynthesis